VSAGAPGRAGVSGTGAVAAGAEAFASLSAHLRAVLWDDPESLLGKAAAGSAAGISTGQDHASPAGGRPGSARRDGGHGTRPDEGGKRCGSGARRDSGSGGNQDPVGPDGTGRNGAGPAATRRGIAAQEGAGGKTGLTAGEVISNAAVLMFGGIETTEGMIANALLHLLSHPGQLQLVRDDPSLTENAVEESLRLEPAAAMIDRYATRDVRLGEAAVRRGDLVSVSLAGAGRDPATFADPDGFDVLRPNARQHLAFAIGPHFCLGAHLARLEAVTAVRAALRLPGLRLDPDRPSAPRGLVFRKPPSLWVRWDAG